MGTHTIPLGAEAWPPKDARWTVRMLGRFDILSSAGTRPKFRSKSVHALLAYLALHPGQDVSRFVLEETIWPDSDSDKQAQNLRRAITDLRAVLGCDDDRIAVIETRRDIVSFTAKLIASDAKRFLEISELGLQESDEDLLFDAIALYDGPLLASLLDTWVYSYRLEYEERFGQCVSALCALRVAADAPKDALRLARSALLLAPSREDIHVALIYSYRSAGMESEAIRQYEDLERMMDENWGEPPSSQARNALEGSIPVTPRKPAPRGSESLFSFDSEPSGGAVALTSRSYVRRPADDRAEACLVRGESVILIQGPRQVGKSSLLARVLDYAHAGGGPTVLSDFQALGETQLADEERLYKTLAHGLCTHLNVELDLQKSWSEFLGPNMNLDAVVNTALSQVDGHVCWGIDEADRIFGRPYSNDFFGLLRSWHNRRALDSRGPWGKLTLVLAYSTEAHMFITDLDQSPFNVGVKIPLRDFSIVEVTELAERYGITGSEEIATAHRITNGHPFLARRALAYLGQGGTAKELDASASLADGPFGDHLQAMLASVLRDPDLVVEVRRMQAGEPFVDPKTRFRLMAMGVLSPVPGAQPEFRVPAYGAYLRSVLD